MSTAENIVVKTIVRIALRIVRRWLNRTIGKFTVQDLYVAIRENRDLWVATPDNMKRRGQQFKKTYKGLYEEHFNQINTKLLLEWLQEDHYDLHSLLINTPGGIAWFSIQIEKIKKELLGL